MRCKNCGRKAGLRKNKHVYDNKYACQARDADGYPIENLRTISVPEWNDEIDGSRPTKYKG